MKKEQGVISVFLIFIFLGLLSLAGLFIDASRLLAAGRRVETALHTALRSTLAAYQPDLVGEFGLYAVDWRQQEKAFQNYFHLNLKGEKSKFKLFNCEIMEAELISSPDQSLLNDILFLEQIEAYMKYRGPLLLLKNVTKPFLDDSEFAKVELWQQGTHISRLIQEMDTAKGEVNHLLLEIKEGSAEVKVKKLAELEKLLEQLAPSVAEMPGKMLSFKGITSEDWVKLGERIADLKKAAAHNRSIWQTIITLEEGEHLWREKEKLVILEELPRDYFNLEDYLLDQEAEKEKQFSLDLLTGLSEREIKNSDLINEETVVDSILPELRIEAKIEKMRPNNQLAEELGTNVFTYLQDLRGLLSAASQKCKANFYQVEYLLDKYCFATGKVDPNSYFSRGEVEYILCGQKREVDNLLQIRERIWQLRFAYNVVECFAKSNLPSLRARLAEALVKGYLEAARDLKALYRGESVKIGAFPLELSYADHLRLFLLVQNEKIQLNRMRQLIQVNLRQENPDFELKNQAAVLAANVKVGVDLWFAKLLSLKKEVVVERTFVWGYGGKK